MFRPSIMLVITQRARSDGQGPQNENRVCGKESQHVTFSSSASQQREQRVTRENMFHSYGPIVVTPRTPSDCPCCSYCNESNHLGRPICGRLPNPITSTDAALSSKSKESGAIISAIKQLNPYSG